MSNEPRYSFGDVDGVMNDGTSVSIGFTGDHVDISFDYRDAVDGQWYHVEASGYRTKKEE